MGSLARSGLVGLILGLIAVAIIRPLVPAAAVLIIALCIAVATAVGSLVSAMRRKPAAVEPGHDPKR